MGFISPLSNLNNDDTTATEKAVNAQSNSPPNNGVDPIVLAFFYLLEASSITSESANIHAKQLNQNALSQERLNNEAAALKWHYIPKETDVHKHSVMVSHWTNHWGKSRAGINHWTVSWLGSHGIEKKYKYWTKKIVTTCANGAVINNAMAKNQEVAAERQILADRLTVMQQQAQINETNVSTIVNEGMQTMQEGVNLLQILRSLTFHALLRQPVRG